MSRRAILIAVVSLGLLGLTNIIVLTVYLPRLIKSKNSTSAVADQNRPSPAPASTSARASSPAAVAATSPASAHVPLPDGAVVQRKEVSPSGNIRVKYVRSKGNPVRQIILENVQRPDQSTRLFEYQRNAWVLVSPNDEWIALNNRPKPGESELQLFHRTVPDSLKYEIPEEFRGEDPDYQGSAQSGGNGQTACSNGRALEVVVR